MNQQVLVIMHVKCSSMIKDGTEHKKEQLSLYLGLIFIEQKCDIGVIILAMEVKRLTCHFLSLFNAHKSIVFYLRTTFMYMQDGGSGSAK